jgi:glycosyltransferase involved in cell wall biosynthesis
VATLAARHARVPVVINHVRGYSFHEYMRSSKRILFERMEAWAARRCEATVFVNNEDRQYAVQSWKVPAAKCHTVYNGADLAVVSSAAVESRRQRFRAQYGWDENEVIVAVLGRLDDQKQPLIVPRIARRLASYHLDKPWRIVVAGDGRLRQQLEVEITQYDLSHRVKLIGWQESPVDVLHASDILLLPSLWEGLPRVLIEAHAAGLPCVASRIRGNREVVSKETGILVDPQSVTDYAAALTHLIENKLERARLGRLARIRAELLFDSQRNNAAMIRLYYKLLQMPIQDERRVAA